MVISVSHVSYSKKYFAFADFQCISLVKHLKGYKETHYSVFWNPKIYFALCNATSHVLAKTVPRLYQITSWFVVSKCKVSKCKVAEFQVSEFQISEFQVAEFQVSEFQNGILGSK